MRGDLRHHLLPDGQTRINAEMDAWYAANPGRHGPYVVSTHRGAGKSFLLVNRSVARCLQYPGQNVRFGAPHYRQAQEIVSESFPKIMADCPDDIKFQKSDNWVRFWNPRWNQPKAFSTLWLFGSLRETIQSQRGLRSNVVACDEVRDWDELMYCINDVLLFTTVRQYLPEFWIASTPPDSPGHPFWSHLVPEAMARKSYFVLTADDNQDFLPEDRERLIQSCGGTDSVAWKREALCHNVVDESRAVCPEFQANKAKVLQAVTRPSHSFSFVVADLGFKDLSAVLFAYTDFENCRMVYRTEVVLHNTGTSELAAAIKSTKADFNKSQSWDHRCFQFADAPPQQLFDLEHDHSLFFTPVDKWDKFASLAAFRAALKEGRIIIHPDCKNLVYQLESGIFNKTRKDFERTVGNSGTGLELGHLDAIDAAIYLWRMARDWLVANPFPPGRTNVRDMFVAERSKRNAAVTSTPIIITRHRV